MTLGLVTLAVMSKLSKPQGRERMDPGGPGLPSEDLGGLALGEGQPPWVAA